METRTDVMDRTPRHSAGPTGHGHPYHDPPAQAADAGWLTPAAPHAPGPWRAAPEIPIWLAGQIGARLVKANFEHLRHAWTRRWSDPISPQAIFYLFADPVLRLTYRTFPAADEPRLPYLLYDLIPHVRAQLTAGQDIRDAQCTVVEEMRSHATFVGVAVSSLDTPAGAWADVWPAAGSELHIPGRGYVWLVDDTVMVIDRFARDRFGRVTIHTNQPRIRTGDTGFPVTIVPELAAPELQSVADPEVLIHLRELTVTVLTAGGHHAR